SPDAECTVFLRWPLRCRRGLHSFPTRRSSDLAGPSRAPAAAIPIPAARAPRCVAARSWHGSRKAGDRAGEIGRIKGLQILDPLRSEEHTSELQSRENLVCRLLLEKKKKHPLEQ